MCENKDCQHKKKVMGADRHPRTIAKYEESMACLRPELAKEYRGLWPADTISLGCSYLSDWECSVCGHKWNAAISPRTLRGCGCPECKKVKLSKTKVLAPYKQSLAYNFPNLLKEYLGSQDPKTVYFSSKTRVNWRCSVCCHEWPTMIYNRTAKNPSGCPECKKKQVSEKLLLAPFRKSLAYKFPKLAKEYRGDRDPKTVYTNCHLIVEWQCSVCSNKWPAEVGSRVRGNGCPECAKGKRTKTRTTAPYKKSLAYKFPGLLKEYLGAQDPRTVYSGSKISVYWKCRKCSHKWPAPIYSRTGSQKCGCRNCTKYGHNETKPSFVYLIYRPGQIQYGIMNIWTDRLKQHARKGWELLDKIEVTGRKARSLETKIKQTLRAKGIPVGREAFREKFEGFTEAFREVDLYARSLRGLCRKLGIDLEAFLAA